MQEQRERARASWKGAAKQTANPAYQQLPKSDFEGYRQTRSDGCEILAIIHNVQIGTSPRLMEGRSQTNRQPGLSATPQVRLRGLSPNPFRRLRNSRHHS